MTSSNSRYLEVFDGIVDPNLALSLNSHLSSPQGGWVLLAHGNEGDSHLHWKADFDYASSKGLHAIIASLEKTSGKKFEVLRTYVNGMTTGQFSTVHLDDYFDGMYTVLVYLNSSWQADWHGETLFYDDTRTEIIRCITPKFARLVLFDGRIPHGTVPPTIQCLEQRRTLAFKLKEIKQ